jgi:hypothetical protein
MARMPMFSWFYDQTHGAYDEAHAADWLRFRSNPSRLYHLREELGLSTSIPYGMVLAKLYGMETKWKPFVGMAMCLIVKY